MFTLLPGVRQTAVGGGGSTWRLPDWDQLGWSDKAALQTILGPLKAAAFRRVGGGWGTCSPSPARGTWGLGQDRPLPSLHPPPGALVSLNHLLLPLPGSGAGGGWGGGVLRVRGPDCSVTLSCGSVSSLVNWSCCQLCGLPRV